MSGVSTATVLAGAAIGSSVIGAGVSAMGQAQQAAAASAQAGYQAQVQRNNAILAQRNAALATQEGEAAAEQQGLKTRSIIGSQRAALAAQGGDVNSGSDLDLQTDTSRAGAQDQEAIRYNAALKAYGYNVEAAGDTTSAGNYDRAATNASDNLPFAVGSTLLGGASKAAGTWFSYMRPTTGNPAGAGQ